MKLAAVDIGSNAIRLQITKVVDYQDIVNFKKVEYVRFPLRLGKDVFETGKIGPSNEEKFMKLMQAFKLLIDLYEVDDYLICATSAMRESENGRSIADRVEKNIGLIINIIDGDEEAEIINKVISLSIDEKTYLHIDVGGGSTELNLYVNKQKINAQSFKIGSVRRLGKYDSPQIWQQLNDWINEHVKKHHKSIDAIGTGGNINKIMELAKKKTGQPVSLLKILEIQKYLNSYTLDERINLLQLNPDRADVIIPASEIYVAVMRAAGAGKITVPDAGMKDGMMQVLYERNKKVHAPFHV
ncbi:MAG: phosphatase [Bacteroidota bacterium]|nr:phosphatase [Bacteroidota bacterium]